MSKNTGSSRHDWWSISVGLAQDYCYLRPVKYRSTCWYFLWWVTNSDSILSSVNVPESQYRITSTRSMFNFYRPGGVSLSSLVSLMTKKFVISIHCSKIFWVVTIQHDQDTGGIRHLSVWGRITESSNAFICYFSKWAPFSVFFSTLDYYFSALIGLSNSFPIFVWLWYLCHTEGFYGKNGKKFSKKWIN